MMKYNYSKCDVVKTDVIGCSAACDNFEGNKERIDYDYNSCQDCKHYAKDKEQV